MGFLRLFIVVVILAQVLLILAVVVFSRKVRRILRSGRPSGERKGVLMTDPVCGSLVEEAMAEVLEKDDRKYYFCSRRCREEFMEK